MDHLKTLCVLALLAAAAVDLVNAGLLGAGVAGYSRGPAYAGGGFGGAYSGPPRPYNFQYAVRDGFGNDYGQHESGNGAGNVNGQYQVLLPDGRNQVVTYSASDATGYIADVQYTGQPHFGGGAGGAFRGGAGAFAGHGGTYLPPYGK